MTKRIWTWIGAALAVVVGVGALAVAGPWRDRGDTGPVRTVVLSMKDYTFNGKNPTLAFQPGERVRFIVSNDVDSRVLHNFRVVGMNVEDFYLNAKLVSASGKRRKVSRGARASQRRGLRRCVFGWRRDRRREEVSPLPHGSRKNWAVNGPAVQSKRSVGMIKRRVKGAGLPANICNHTFRATGITTFLLNGGTVEKAQAIAGHESPRTTKLYDRRNDEITLDEIERILI